MTLERLSPHATPRARRRLDALSAMARKVARAASSIGARGRGPLGLSQKRGRERESAPLRVRRGFVRQRPLREHVSVIEFELDSLDQDDDRQG